jgi:glycosyltransferase involved in cell wall biosynthesis
MNNNYKLSIIIPAHNEAKNLPILLKEIDLAMKFVATNHEIIVINDGRTDETTETLSTLSKKNNHLKTITLNKKMGQSNALWQGINSAKGATILTIDADLQNDPKDIPILIKNFSDIDMVTGYRRDRKDSLVKLLSSKIANFIRKKTLKSTVIDSACGFKIFKKNCLNNIKYFDGIHRFLPDLFIRNNFTVKQVAINHKPRIYGKSNYNTRNRIFKSFFDLLKIKFKKI